MEVWGLNNWEDEVALMREGGVWEKQAWEEMRSLWRCEVHVRHEWLRQIEGGHANPGEKPWLEV